MVINKSDTMLLVQNLIDLKKMLVDSNHLLHTASREVAEMIRKIEVDDIAGMTLYRNLLNQGQSYSWSWPQQEEHRNNEEKGIARVVNQ